MATFGQTFMKIYDRKILSGQTAFHQRVGHGLGQPFCIIREKMPLTEEEYAVLAVYLEDCEN